MNVPLPVTVIFNPSRAVSDAEPKISHPILAACADATTLADNSSARGVAGAAVGAPLSHARATAIATRPKNLASHLLEFIVPPCRCQHEPHDASDPGSPARRRTNAPAGRPAVVSRDCWIGKKNATRRRMVLTYPPRPARQERRSAVLASARNVSARQSWEPPRMP